MSSHDTSNWMPCSEGTLESTIERVRSHRRKTIMIRCVSGTVAGALIFAIVSFYSSTKSSTLDCYEVSGLLAGYVAGDLDQTTFDLVEQHLASCEKCRIKLRGLQANKPTTMVRFVRAHQSISEGYIEPRLEESYNSL